MKELEPIKNELKAKYKQLVDSNDLHESDEELSKCCCKASNDAIVDYIIKNNESVSKSDVNCTKCEYQDVPSNEDPCYPCIKFNNFTPKTK